MKNRESKSHVNKKVIIASLIALTIAIIAASQSHNGTKVIDGAVDHEFIYTLVSRSPSDHYGDVLQIHKRNGEQGQVYESDFLQLKPWKVEVSDVDGDGVNDIIVAVRKTTHFDDEEKNRLFIFNFDGEVLFKKWTGSQIAGEWRDFIVGELVPIPGDELIFIEQLPGQGERLQIYYWFDFGFSFLAASELYDQIVGIEILAENEIQMIARRGQHENTSILTLENGKLIELHKL